MKNSPFRVQRIWLFGSHARGDNSKNSDIDIGVEYDTIEKEDAMMAKGLIKNKMPNNVDIHVINHAKWDICLNCGIEGIIIWGSKTD